MKSLFDRNFYLPILNGFIGDKLAKTGDSWAISMSFRKGGKDIPLEEVGPQVKGKDVVIFVHGLMASDTIWKYFSSLEKDFTTLHLRYNTGLHIYENGQELAKMLHRLHDRYPMKNIYLLGHSMGGLVTRSACHYARKHHFRWVSHVPAVFLIAVPNAGAALEKLGHVTTATLNRIARWHLGTIGNLLDQRSNGIKDLRLGSMLEEDWAGLKDHLPVKRTPVPPIPGIRYHILVGNLTSDEKSLMGRYFGDGLVTQDSAVAATLFKISDVKIFTRTGHNSILRSADAIDYVRKILRNGGKLG